jgi:hypothetical protein
MSSGFCPGCGKKVTYDEKKMGSCSYCEHPLEADVPAFSARPPKRPLSVTDPWAFMAWGTVRAALALTFAGMILFLCSGLLIFAIVVSAASKWEASEFSLILLGLSSLGLLGGAFLICIGMSMSIAAPEVGARGWGIGVCICIALSLALVLPGLVMSLQAQAKRERGSGIPAQERPRTSQPSTSAATGPGLLTYALWSVASIGGVFYVLFLSSVARCFGRRRLSEGLLIYLGFSLVGMGLPLLLFRGASPLVALATTEGQVLIWILGGYLVFLWVWFLLLVALVRGAITDGLLKS